MKAMRLSIILLWVAYLMLIHKTGARLFIYLFFKKEEMHKDAPVVRIEPQ